MRLWETSETRLDEAVLSFTVGEDPILDQELLPYDCLGSAAHAMMLARIGLLSDEERDILLAALKDAYARALAGELKISVEQEDGHTALEDFLSQATGQAGRKIHTGRSRNDQVMVALRLLVRERLLALGAGPARGLVESLLEKGAQHRATVMPGYTHTRQAMPSTAGQLFFAAAEGLIRDLQGFLVPLGQANRSPLGAAAGYGVPLPLDRYLVADLLGFEGVDINTLHAQNIRGRLEATTLAALHQLSLTLARLAVDLIWFSSEAFGFFELPGDLTTGSSIMPQKQNPDILELVRAVPSGLLGGYAEVTSLLQGLPAGYHRDLQRTKAPLIHGLRRVEDVVAVMQPLLERLKVNTARCRDALSAAVFATDRAYAHVRQGVPFRDAYRLAKLETDAPPPDVDSALRSRDHLGAPGTDQSEILRDELRGVMAELEPFARGVQRARSLCAAGVR